MVIPSAAVIPVAAVMPVATIVPVARAGSGWDCEDCGGRERESDQFPIELLLDT
jgi:hypothetical protein